MNETKQKLMEMAIDNLIGALDKTPRTDWRQVVWMALQASKDLGYSEGYRVASSPITPQRNPDMDASPIGTDGGYPIPPAPSNDTGLEEGLADLAGFSGEDRSLSKKGE